MIPYHTIIRRVLTCQQPYFYHLILTEFAACSGAVIVLRTSVTAVNKSEADSLAIAVRRSLAELKRERHLLTEFLCIPSLTEMSRLDRPDAAISMILAL